MITIFKKFENEEYIDGKFWEVKIDDDLIKCRLYKIGMEDDDVDRWLKHVINSNMLRQGTIYIGVYMIPGLNELDWSYSTQKRSLFDIKNYKFMGEVILTEDDMEKYNLKNDINKYNL